MSYELRPSEQCLYCHTDIFIPPKATSVRCRACRRVISVSPAMLKEKEYAHDIERLRTQGQYHFEQLSAKIENLTNQFFGTREGAIQELFRQGENAQLRGDFEEAIAHYQKLLEKSPYEAEVHWRIMLCRFGVEYVYEHSSNASIPTFTRMHIDVIASDKDYLRALELAPQNSDLKIFYKEEALHLQNILNEYHQLRSEQTPYDVFISVKQGDSFGKPTQDSLTARNLYNQLNRRGLKVFNSEITLKKNNIAGENYEPHIMHAISTAKVMVVIASSEEYMYSAWLKNEWHRFRWLKDHSDKPRFLIACIIGKSRWPMLELGGLQALHLNNHSSSLKEVVQEVLAHVSAKKSPVLPITIAGVALVTAAGIYALTGSGGSVDSIPSDSAISSLSLPEVTATPTSWQSSASTQIPTATKVVTLTPTVSPTAIKTATATPTTTPTATPDSPTVSILDAALKKELLKALKKPSNESITVKDLEGLTSLNLASCGIQNLEGLEYCTNLTELSLNNNQISNIQPLANLTSLKSLSLSGNSKPIIGYSVISNLKKSGCSVSDTKVHYFDSTNNSDALLNRGSKGDIVVDVQERLDELGFFSDTIDGDYGRYTVSVVQAFQRACGLSETGNVDSTTFQRLFASDAPTTRHPVVKTTATPTPTKAVTVTTKKPGTTTPKPNITTKKPGTTTPRPETWSSWSSWSTTPVSETSTRQVETKTESKLVNSKTTYTYTRYIYKNSSTGRYESTYSASHAKELGQYITHQETSSTEALSVGGNKYGKTYYSGPSKNYGTTMWWNQDTDTEKIYSNVTYYRYRTRLN